jgi:hypothetical protein
MGIVDKVYVMNLFVSQKIRFFVDSKEIDSHESKSE